MRIAIAHPFLWPEVRRGAERYVDDLAWYLCRNGHQVEIITGTEGPSSTETRSDGAVVSRRHHVGMAKLARVGVDKVQAFFLTALPRLRSGHFDLVHAMVPSASLAAGAARTPVVFTFIGHPTQDQVDELARSDRFLFRAANRTATRTTALSTASAASIEDLFGRRPDVLAPGVRLDRFPADPAARTGPPRILFSAAPADRRKNLDLVLRALPAVLDRLPDARLQISGQGDASWALDTLDARDRRRVQDALDVLGPGALNDISGRYRAATVTVLPAVHEAFGLALVESLASGTPVVASRDGGMTDIVTHTDVGQTFPAGDVGKLADALLAVVSNARDPATPAACALHAWRWGWVESIGPAHERLYEELRSSSTLDVESSSEIGDTMHETPTRNEE